MYSLLLLRIILYIQRFLILQILYWLEDESIHLQRRIEIASKEEIFGLSMNQYLPDLKDGVDKLDRRIDTDDRIED
jgi:hypothetical protein